MDLAFIASACVVALIFILKTFKVVPQQEAWVIERFGRFDRAMEPGLNFMIPLADRVAYKHSLKEVAIEVPGQVCITKDNTQLQVDGIIFYQVTDPVRASYGSIDYVASINQLAQTTLRSEIGKTEFDKTFQSREMINASILYVLDSASSAWGVKVLRYEIKDLTPPADILRAMQTQITAEREKRALIASSEGRRDEQINLAEGQRAATVAKSEADMQARINAAKGEAEAILAVAQANAKALEVFEESVQKSGEQTVHLKVAERAVEAYATLAKNANAVIVPNGISDVSALIGSAMSLSKGGKTQ